MKLENYQEDFSSQDNFVKLKTYFHNNLQKIPLAYQSLIKQFNHNISVHQNPNTDDTQFQQNLFKTFIKDTSRGRTSQNCVTIFLGYNFKPDVWKIQNLSANIQKDNKASKITQNVFPEVETVKDSQFKRISEKQSIYDEEDLQNNVDITIKSFGENCQSLQSTNQVSPDKTPPSRYINKLLTMIPGMQKKSSAPKSRRKSNSRGRSRHSSMHSSKSTLQRLTNQFWTVKIQRKIQNKQKILTQSDCNSSNSQRDKKENQIVRFDTNAKLYSDLPEIQKVIEQNSNESIESAQYFNEKQISYNSIKSDELQAQVPLTEIIKKTSEKAQGSRNSRFSGFNHFYGQLKNNLKHQQTQIYTHYYLFLPVGVKPSLEISHYLSKIVVLLKNYLHFHPNNCLQHKDFSLGQHLQNFLYKNSVGQVEIHIKVRQQQQPMKEKKTNFDQQTTQSKTILKRLSKKDSFDTLNSVSKLGMTLLRNSSQSRISGKVKSRQSLTKLANNFSNIPKKQFSTIQLQIQFIEKLSTLSFPTTKRKDFQTMKNVYQLKNTQKIIKDDIKCMKTDVEIKINQLLALTNFELLSYNQITIDTMRKLRAQNIKQKIEKLKILTTTHQSLDLRIKDYQDRKHQLQQRIQKQNALYMEKVDNLRKEIKQLELQNSASKAALNSKVYSEKLDKKNNSFSKKNSSAWYTNKQKTTTNPINVTSVNVKSKTITPICKKLSNI